MSARHAEILLIVVSIIAAGGWILSKGALAEFSPYTFMGIRFVTASAVLVLFSWRDIGRLSRGQVGRCLATGAALGCGLLCWGVALSKAEQVGEGAFIVSLSVVVVPLLGRVFFAERFTPSLFLALLPALAGLALLSLENGFTFETSQLLFLLATVAFAMHLNLSSHFVKGIPPLALSSLQLGMAGSMATIMALTTETWREGISIDAWGFLLCSALIATSLRFALQTRALQTLAPSHASMIFLSEPVFTAALGALLLNERMSNYQLLGCGLIFMALFVFRGAPWLKQILRGVRAG